MQYIVVILTFLQHLFLKIAATLEKSNLRIMSNYKYYTTILSKVSFDNELFSKEYEIVSDYVEKGYSGNGWDHSDPELGEIYWAIEEATWLRVTANGDKLANAINDLLIDKVISSTSRENLINATRALDRVLLWGHYVIPQWHISAYRTLYWDIFDKPKIRPKYSLGTNTWWIDKDKASTIDQRKKSIQ